MGSPEKELEGKVAPQRKTYLKPALDIVPLLPKQTVLGGECFSSSNTAGEELVIGCGLTLCLLGQ